MTREQRLTNTVVIVVVIATVSAAATGRLVALLAILGWTAAVAVMIVAGAMVTDERRRGDTATALWKQAEVDKAALEADNARLRSALPRDNYVDLTFERLVRGRPPVGRVGDWDRDGA